VIKRTKVEKADAVVQVSDGKAEITQLSRELDEANRELENLTASLNSSQETIEDFNDREAEHDRTLAEVADNYAHLEASFHVMVKENDALKGQLEATERRSQKLQNQLIRDEQADHQRELETVGGRLSARIAELERELTSKREKCRSMKSKLRGIQKDYSTAFEKQKSSILEAENSTFSEPTEESVLNSAVVQAKAENTEQRRTIASLQDQLARVADSQNSFWQAKIATIQTEHAKQLELERQKWANSSLLSQSLDLRETKAAELAGWEDWGRGLICTFTNGQMCVEPSDRVRFILGEMIATSMTDPVVSDKLTSLRAQKALLTKQSLPPRSPQRRVTEFRQLTIVVLFCVRIQKFSPYGNGPC
jgi:chromosome segregation ATPase